MDTLLLGHKVVIDTSLKYLLNDNDSKMLNYALAKTGWRPDEPMNKIHQISQHKTTTDNKTKQCYKTTEEQIRKNQNILHYIIF